MYRDLRSSVSGYVGFTVPTGHRLKVGDRIQVLFTLGDAKGSRVERTAVVRRLSEGNYLGCEFVDFDRVDTATGFYVMI